MWIFYCPDIETDMELPQEEAGHCIRVLRLKEGDMIRLTDGKGGFHDARITSVTGKRCFVHIEKSEMQPALWNGYVRIAVAPTKLMDRNEWFVEKAVEIGVNEITFIDTDHSERNTINLDRIGRIAVSAMKQSKKATLPAIGGMVRFKDLVSEPFDGDRFIAHCDEGERIHLMDALVPGRNTMVLIGPEGDFSPEEIRMALDAGFRPVSLGDSRLRTETAALASVMMMNLNARLK
ncbi:MAG: 16S rRNA (uracil(1498)-N(3))-methyltransferase [Bacteroidaceae bacterium]|nr:16S rRNA (uracil(1498)-N(3))-methyltransferase [Bacteroidaceae bacterium]